MIHDVPITHNLEEKCLGTSRIIKSILLGLFQAMFELSRQWFGFRNEFHNQQVGAPQIQPSSQAIVAGVWLSLNNPICDFGRSLNLDKRQFG